MTSFTTIFVTTLSLIASVSHDANAEIIAQGNLIFIKSDRPATLNPTFIHFHRTFDFRTLEISLRTLDNFVKMYHNFCVMTETYHTKDPDIHYIPDISYRNAQYRCNQYRAQLAEVRSDSDIKFIKTEMIKKNWTEIYAGLSYVDNKYLYLSDMKESFFTTTILCKDCTIQNRLLGSDYAYVLYNQGDEVHFKYVISKGTLAIMPVGHKPDDPSCPKLPVICLRRKTAEQSVLQAIARQSCVREEEELKRINTHLREELAQFAHPSLVKPPKDSNIRRKREIRLKILRANRPRKKRAIGLIGAGIGAGILGIESLHSIINAVSPLSLMGKGLAAIFGFATASDLRLTQKQLLLHSQAITNLTMNQQILIEGYKKVNEEIEQLRESQNKQEHDIAVLFANIDNKLAVRNLQYLLQITLLKMSQSIASANSHQTSPYVLGKADLKKLTETFRGNNVPLTDNINDVITSLAIIDNMFTFIFAAPILTQKNDLYLYEIRDLPVYKNNKQFKSKINHRYIAISIKDDTYVTLTEAEYFNCIQYFICTTAAPFTMINKDSPCEVLSLKYESSHCELEAYDGPMENFLTYNNVTYYSLSDTMEIHIVCEDSQSSFNQHRDIHGNGKIQIAPGCNIKIANKANIRPSYVVSRHNLEGDTFFKLLEVPGNLPNLYPTTPAPSNTSRPPIHFNEITSIKDVATFVFNQDTTIAEIIRILFYILTIFSILGTIYCCFPRFRLWFNGCCFIEKPTKYWRDVKGYVVPEYISKQKQRQASSPESKENEIEAPVPMDIDPVEMQTDIPKHEPIVTVRPPPYPFDRLHRLYNPKIIQQFRQHHRAQY